MLLSQSISRSAIAMSSARERLLRCEKDLAFPAALLMETELPSDAREWTESPKADLRPGVEAKERGSERGM